jgi:hypothetical protein
MPARIILNIIVESSNAQIFNDRSRFAVGRITLDNGLVA